MNEAKEALLAILARDPANREALIGLADLVERAGYLPEACGLLTEAGRLYPEDAKIAALRGGVLARAGDLPEARASFELARYLAPQDRAIRRKYAEALAGAEQFFGDVAFSEAWRLEEKERYAEARRAYLTILARDRTHLGALVNLGTIHLRYQRRTLARLMYLRAVAAHPAARIARINLARLIIEETPELARVQFEALIAADPDDVEGLAGLARLAEDRGDFAAARDFRARAVRKRRIIFSHYSGSGRPLRMLLLETADDGNVPLPLVLDRRRFLMAALAVEAFDPRQPLPPHDLVLNTIGDADRCAAALALAEAILAQTKAPLINAPAAVLATTRARNARRLRTIEGVITPRIVRTARADFLGEDGARRVLGRGFSFPLLLRAPGFHTGKYFVEVRDAADFPAAVRAMPGDDVLVLERLDASGPDGKVRKYRAIAVDGTLYPLHAAISTNWKVHYFSADMTASAEHRAEDEAFLADMPGTLGPRAMAALGGIVAALGLDYAGIDFGLDRAGNVLVFEANATMLVPPAGTDPRFAYRKPAIERIVVAAQTMIFTRAGVRVNPPRA
jgi:Flp pilus assembly protein TadD